VVFCMSGTPPMPMERSPRRKVTRDAPGTQFEEHLDAPHEVVCSVAIARPPPPRLRTQARSGAGDGNRTRVTSLVGASGQSVHAGCYASGAGHPLLQSSVVDRGRPPDADATGTRRARPARTYLAWVWRRWSQAQLEGEAHPRWPLASLATAEGRAAVRSVRPVSTGRCTSDQGTNRGI
jgi:hypothetical protein